jgi:hypothetical protein
VMYRLWGFRRRTYCLRRVLGGRGRILCLRLWQRGALCILHLLLLSSALRSWHHPNYFILAPFLIQYTSPHALVSSSSKAKSPSPSPTPSNPPFTNPKRKRNHLRNPHQNIPLRTPKKILPSPIPPQPHPLNLHRLKRIHRNTPHKTNMHPKSSMYPRTTQADKDSEFRRRPLRGRRAAVAAAVVLGGFLNLVELCFS